MELEAVIWKEEALEFIKKYSIKPSDSLHLGAIEEKQHQYHNIRR
jgi:hypothetical protein